MDISEATTIASQESPCFSPDTELVILENSNKVATSSMATSTISPTNNQILDNRDQNIQDIDDDDDDIEETDLIENKNQTPFRKTLTLVSKHPLMSPSAVTPESQSPRKTTFHYPDIVPLSDQVNERLDIVNDFDNEKQKNLVSRDQNSPDYLTDTESEPDLSQYQATVAPSFQTVALISTGGYKQSDELPRSTRRLIPVSADLLSDDISSIDTISNQSLDDDIEQNLASLSPCSSIMEDITLNEKIKQGSSPPKTPVEPIPEYTAAEERRDSRNWQKITLPDGKTREIDMKVIDPYKRVLSHGGYLKAGGHNAIVLFSACHLPDRSRTDYHYVMDNLFLLVFIKI